MAPAFSNKPRKAPSLHLIAGRARGCTCHPRLQAPSVEALVALHIGFLNRWCRLQKCYSRSDILVLGITAMPRWERYGTRTERIHP
jgi:hypothetical protein